MLGDDTRAALNGAPCAVAIAPVGYAEHPAPLARIGIAYNSTPEAAAALALARELAEQIGASLHALEVVSIPTVAYTGIVAPALGESIEIAMSKRRTFGCRSSPASTAEPCTGSPARSSPSSAIKSTY